MEREGYVLLVALIAICTQIYMRESEECEHNTSLRKDSNGVV